MNRTPGSYLVGRSDLYYLRLRLKGDMEVEIPCGDRATALNRYHEAVRVLERGVLAASPLLHPHLRGRTIEVVDGVYRLRSIEEKLKVPPQPATGA